MSKCGKGLGKEFAMAVLNEDIPQVFTTDDLRKFIETNEWNPSEKYINVYYRTVHHQLTASPTPNTSKVLGMVSMFYLMTLAIFCDID